MKIIPDNTFKKYIRTVGVRNEIDRIMRLSLVIQRVFGQHILDPDWTWKRFISHQLATAVLIIYVVLGTVEILTNTSDIKVIAEGCYTLVVTTMFVFKYLLLVNNRYVFRKLYVEIKTMLYDTIRFNSVEKLNDLLKKSSRMVFGLFFMVLCPIGIYILRVMWYYFYGERVTLSRTTSTLFPMKTPYHEIGLILHSIYMLEVSHIFIVVDMWFVIYMLFFCAATDCAVKILTVEKTIYESPNEYAIRLNESLRSFYKVHVRQVG
jgi:hypothetical protein